MAHSRCISGISRKPNLENGWKAKKTIKEVGYAFESSDAKNHEGSLNRLPHLTKFPRPTVSLTAGCGDDPLSEREGGNSSLFCQLVRPEETQFVASKDGISEHACALAFSSRVSGNYKSVMK